ITKEPLTANAVSYYFTSSYQQQQGWNYWHVAFTGADESTLLKAYCDYGATSINDYAWNDPYYSTTDKFELFNDSDMLTGYLQGVNYCKQAWGGASTSPNPSASSTPTPNPTSTPSPSSLISPTPLPSP